MGDVVWIKSEPDNDGRYHLYLELGPDDVVPLDQEAAYRWAREVLSAAAQAEYDAAVMRQLKWTGAEPQDAANAVVFLRERRGNTVPISAVPDLALVPGVSAFSGKGFLRLERRGKSVGQWDIADAKTHALAVIEAYEVTILDSAYLTFATKEIGADWNTGLAMVTDLYRFRGTE